MRADQLLEGRDLVGLRPVGAVDHDVGAVGEAVGAARRGRRRAGRTARAGRRRRRRRRRAGARRRRRARASPRCSSRTSTKPMPGWARSAGQQRRVARVDARSSVTRPGTRGKRDQAEAAGGHHRRSRAARSPSRRRRLLDLGAGRRRERVRTARGRRAVAGRRLGQRRRLSWPPASSLSPLAGDVDALASASQASRTSSSSVDAVALAERRALGLAVVGEHDELVRARRRSAAAARCARSRGRRGAAPASVSARSMPEWWATSS